MYTYFIKKQTINRAKQEVINSLDTLLFKEEVNYISVFPFCYFDPKYYSQLKKRRLAPYYGEKRNNGFEFRAPTILNSFRTIRFEVEVIPEDGKTLILIKFKLTKFEIISLAIGVPIFFGLLLASGIGIDVLAIFIFIILIQEFLMINPILRRIKKCVTTK